MSHIPILDQLCSEIVSGSVVLESIFGHAVLLDRRLAPLSYLLDNSIRKHLGHSARIAELRKIHLCA